MSLGNVGERRGSNKPGSELPTPPQWTLWKSGTGRNQETFPTYTLQYEPKTREGEVEIQEHKYGQA